MLPGEVADVFGEFESCGFEFLYSLLLAHFMDFFDGHQRVFRSKLHQYQPATWLEGCKH